MEAIYKNRCPNCGGDIDSTRLELGLFCEKCMDINQEKCKVNLINYKKFCVADEKLEMFNSFFKDKVGEELSPIQKMWAKRFFLGNSFALLAPTGIGKTTFGLLLAAFVKNSYIIFPTKLLVMQAVEKFKNWNIKVLAYTGKKEEKEKIENNKYDILITTTQFLYKNYEIVNKNFDLFFIDDVDSILKSAKKIDLILKLLGIDENTINSVLKLIEKKDYVNLNKIKIEKKGNLIVSSATANPKSKRVLLFKYLLGFEVTKPNLTLRNIEDVFDETYSYEQAVEYIKKLGKGGLLFLPGNENKEKLNEFIEFLTKNNIKAYSYKEFNEHLEEFKDGNCFFVGFASYRNPLSRGIDLPESVRYTLFVGVPKIEFRLNEENYRALYFISLIIYPFLLKKLQNGGIFTFQKYINTLKKYAFFPILHPKVEEKLRIIKDYIIKIIKKYENEIKNSPEISFDGEKIITADITGYIQASGRSSRFYKGHLTKGLALTLVDNEKAFFSLRKKLNWYSNIEFKNIKDVNLEKILEEIDDTRKIKTKVNLKTSFVVVESPTKAKTISSFFGRPSRRIINGVSVYEILLEDRVLLITASIGHDFDLSYEEKWGVKDKYVPIFRILEEKDKILNTLNLTSYEVDEVIIATDPDREGEKIAFDLILNNKPFNLNVKRAEFHEITKYAFVNAINNLRYYDKNLVAAQFVRRISDRWIGFNLSIYLQNLLNNAHLSAGRVQTPVLNWICERTEKLKEKIYVVSVKIDDLKVDWEFENKNKAEEFFNFLTDKIEIKLINSKEEDLFEKPFNTSTLLKEAANKLHYSPQQTMKLAQDLFESGFITYHRTDSFRISNIGKKIAKDYIIENFGETYVKLRSFESGGAHEAIRTTTSMDMNEIKSFLMFKNINFSFNHLKLYDLIFRKFIASQMKEVKIKIDIFKILDKEIEVNNEILEDGFNLIYPLKIYNIKEGIYSVNKNVYQRSKFTPYTYAEIIDEMKNKGIGRPSTYAVTIEKLLDRKYIIEKKGFLFATKLGFKVLSILKKHPLYNFVSEDFTKKLEEIMDLIEIGKKDYKKELIKLYNELFIMG